MSGQRLSLLVYRMDPLEIILVTSGTRGERLLFRYPYETDEKSNKLSGAGKRNPYAIKIAEDFHNLKDKIHLQKLMNTDKLICTIETGQSNTNTTDKYRCSNSILATLLAAKSSLCCQNFDIKMDDIRFIGFPLVLHVTTKQTGHRITTVNVVFSLKSNIDNFIKERYHIISKQITIALQHEERRCHYLSVQAKIMTDLQDEMASRTEDCIESPYKLILQKSKLANELKAIYDSLCNTGIVQTYINHWIEINVCLPKIYDDFLPSSTVKRDYTVIEKCMSALRPYHGVLLTVDEQILLDSLPMDSTPALTRLIKETNPLKNIQTIALDADLSLSQVFQLVCHLIYWAKAVIIYPLCETNTYIISPSANIFVYSPLIQKFVDEFPGKNFHVELAEFNLPKQLQDGTVFENKYQQAQRVKMVIWLLQHQLLLQLHKYISIIPPDLPSIDDNLSIDDNNTLIRTPSISDLASVASDESFGYGPSTINLLSKSPSLDIISTEDGKSFGNCEIILAEMSPEIRQAIKFLPSAKNVEDLGLFLRLCPYFNGTCHIEEIMFYENLSRSQITTLLDKFKDILVISSHEDPATTFST